MANKNSDRNKILGGFVWKFAERSSSQGVTFLISVILARLLMPQEYGLVAMINIFIVFANVFVTSGFTASLIQKKDADELVFSTILYCTLTMSVLMYGIIYLCAPAIAAFYNMPDLVILTRVYSLSLILTSYQTIQQAYVSRHMLFKKTFVSTFCGNIISGIIGIVLAYSGLGVWALIGQYISNILINMFTLMYIIPWKPQMIFSLARAKGLMSYGSKILMSQLVSVTYKELSQLIIGKMYTPADLGLYNRGSHLPKLVNTNMDITIRSVLFPAMSNHSDNPERVKQLLRRGIRTSSYLAFFFLTLLATASEPIVKILLTDKWIESVPYMQIFCIYYMFLVISGYNVQAVKAIGKSNEVLKLEVFKKPLFLIVVFLAAQHSIMAVALVSPLNALYAMAMNMGPSRRCLGYSFKEQMSDLQASSLLALAVFVATWPFTLLNMNEFLVMFLQLIVGFMVFIGLSKIFKVDSYIYVKTTLVDFHNRTKNRK